MSVYVTSFQVDGQRVDISVNDDGRFWAYMLGMEHTSDNRVFADSLATLKKKILAETRGRVRLEIEGHLFEKASWRSSKATFADIVITGRHAGNNNILYRYKQGNRSRQQSRWQRDDFLRKMTPAEQQHFLDTYRAIEVAEAAFDKLKKGLLINIDAEIAKAQKGAKKR